MLPQSLQQPTFPPPFDDGAGEDDRLVELSVYDRRNESTDFVRRVVEVEQTSTS